MNVEQFAQELKLSTGLLLEQLRAAGVDKSAAADDITEQDKARLLDYLSRKHGAREQKGKITLTRRETSEIRRADSTTGKARTIQVEVRKKRVLVKRELPVAGQEPVVEAEDLVPVEEEQPQQIVAEEVIEPVVSRSFPNLWSNPNRSRRLSLPHQNRLKRPPKKWQQHWHRRLPKHQRCAGA